MAKSKKSYRDGILRRMENLRRKFPTHYAQLCVAPMSTPPSYAMEDNNSDWWRSEDAASFYESLNERNIE